MAGREEGEQEGGQEGGQGEARRRVGGEFWDWGLTIFKVFE